MFVTSAPMESRHIAVIAGDGEPETADYYIKTPANGGSDSNNGLSWDTAWATFGKANTVLSGQVGKKVLVDDGNYMNGTGVTLSNGGSSGNYNHYKSKNYGGAHLIGTTSGSQVQAFDLTGDFLKIEGFDISDWASTAAGAHGIQVQSDDCIITRCIIHDIGRISASHIFGMNGIYSAVQTSRITVEKCIFHTIGRTSGLDDHDHGLYLDANPTDWMVRNNIFYNIVKGYVLHFYNDGATGVKILHNTFHESLPNHIQCQALVFNNMTNCRFENNLFYLPAGSGTSWSAGTYSGCTSKNNVCTAATNSPSSPSGVTVSGNLNSQSTGQVALVDASNHDYHLQSGSVCRGAGLNLFSEVSEDFDGVARPNSAGDVGAFQYV